MDDGKLKLIDHGLSFRHAGNPEDDRPHGASFFLQKTVSKERSGEIATGPKDFAKPFVENKEKVLEALKKIGIEKGVRDGVGRRTDRLARASSWADLRDFAKL